MIEHVAMADDIYPLLAHALGLDRSGKPYRNHYLCAAQGATTALWLKAVDMGLAVENRLPSFVDSGRLFTVTEVGRDAAIEIWKAKQPKLTRGQKRYRRWVEIADAVDMTFGEWLKGGCKWLDDA
jgi:hypothetical protein